MANATIYPRMLIYTDTTGKIFDALSGEEVGQVPPGMLPFWGYFLDKDGIEHHISELFGGGGSGSAFNFMGTVPTSSDLPTDAEKGDVRTVLRLHPTLAPVKCAILPLSKKLAEPAHELYLSLVKSFMCDYDDSGSIGKRYRRQDEVGTPFCATFDFESLEDACVTVRERDSMGQTRIPASELRDYIQERIDF